MSGRRTMTVALAAAALPVLTGCGTDLEVHPGPGGEIPITTRSEEARRLYLEGRDLAEKIRPADAREVFEIGRAHV